ncbi:hypothetical protein C0993_003265, partial [Termitomyces sp. T159_Od127]
MAVRTSPVAAPANAAIKNRKVKSSRTKPKNKDEEPIRPQKRRKQSTSNTPSLHPSLQLKNVRGRRGALKDIVEMPLEILHEIFMYLTPGELLSLSRMCKALRCILMTKSAENIWKQARLNLDDELPDCPDDLNEVQFANLIFTPLCDGCKKAKGRYYMWSIRRSYCLACLTGKKGLIRLFQFTDGRKYPDILPLLPAIDPRSKIETVQLSDNHLIYKAYANRLPGKLGGFRKSDDRVAWIKQQKDTRKRRIQHGRMCEEWLRMQVIKRADELDETRQRRYEAIIQKLTDLGWEKELETIEGMSSWPSVNQPKDLTDRVWQNIKDDIIEKLEEHKARRLEKEYLAVQVIRRDLLTKRVSKLEKDIGNKVIFPHIFDLESTGPISALIKAPTGETIEYPESLIVESAQGWRTSCDAVLRNMVVTSTTPTDVDPLSLATTLFSCRNYRGILQYPEVLKHKCYSTFGSKKCLWNANKGISFADKLHSLAKGLLEELGLDPETTTREDVQWPALIIECRECPMQESPRWRASMSLMSWPVAIEHVKKHGEVGGERPRMSRINLTETELER